MELSVVIPAFNESAIIARIISNIITYFEKHRITGEIIAVNDGSTDKTAEILAHLKTFTPCLRVITLKQNKGKGAACRAGLAASTGVWCVIMDADESTTIDTWKLFKPLLNTYDIIIGSRAVRGARVWKRQNMLKVIAGKLGNKLIKVMTGLPFNDTQCGFKAFHERTKPLLLAYARINGWMFDVEWLMIARRMGFQIKETPIEWRNDASSMVKPSDYARALKDVLIIARYVRHIPQHS